ncbi:unnamed protein product [Zymoseptoria tritici ST99CH_3D1]|nr:unnamed protein product [Zymoseptoria tritici ST99CH_3D1]
MRRPTTGRCFAWFISVTLVYIVLSLLGHQITKSAPGEEVQSNAEWVNSGKYWLDRQACRWFGLCGTMHMLNKDAWTWTKAEADDPDNRDISDWWTSGTDDPEKWTKEEIKLRKIPQYVLDHAPYVHLFSGEQFWPGDLSEHLIHTTPFLNYSRISDLDEERNLTNLHELNDYAEGKHSRFMYLGALDNVEERPKWLVGGKNIPKMPAQNDGDLDLDYPWPDPNDDLKDFDLEAAKQQTLDDFYHKEGISTKGEVPAEHLPSDRTASLDGRCGGNSGYTCTGSKFGTCCSIYGWCGTSPAFCGEPCDPLAGTCHDPYAIPQGPHPDLRRRDHDPTLDNPSHKPQPGGKSSAPAILIVVPKPDGVVDAFWFFFYSFNLGQTVLNIRFGNHVGDWEHTTVRFVNGKPTQIFLSEHNFGQALTYSAVEKYIPSHDSTGTMIGSWSNATAASRAKRPVVYSALGSHAMYATPGLHPYILPFGLLHDETDRGPLWDPVQNFQAYTYNPLTRTVRSSTLNPTSPTQWFDFAGHWGDKFYELGDPRQYRFAGQYHYVNGPTGPKFKNLGRRAVCQSGRRGCEVRRFARNERGATATNPEEEEGEDGEVGGLPGGNVTDEAWGV